jgi:hypothetical protein
VRLFSDQLSLQDRLINGLKAAQGTLLFSSQNLAEFCALNDQACAERCEALLSRVLSNLYIADFSADPGFLTDAGGILPEGHPGKYWLAKEVVGRGHGGEITMHRLILDVLAHRDQLLPIFNDTSEAIAQVTCSPPAVPA